jgi:hypothetical protein
MPIADRHQPPLGDSDDGAKQIKFAGAGLNKQQAIALIREWALLPYVRGVDETLGVVDEVIDLLHVIDGVVAPVGEIAEPVLQPSGIWIPGYSVDTPRQLWFEARLENVTQAERAVSLVPEI